MQIKRHELVQRHLISRKTLRKFRTEAMNQRDAITAAV
jgi:hypothetical protein